MQLELKSYSSPDVRFGSWKPKGPEDVYFLLELDIGELGSEPRDSFQVIISTPKALRRNATNDVVSTRGTIVLSHFSLETMLKAINDIPTSCTAPTWNESVLRLQRYFLWEYEDYVMEEEP